MARCALALLASAALLFFAAGGGIYGNYNFTALACYLVGIAVQIPFVAADFYTGPLARAMGGVDLSWLVGIAVVSPVYYFAVRSFQRPQARARRIAADVSGSTSGLDPEGNR